MTENKLTLNFAMISEENYEHSLYAWDSLDESVKEKILSDARDLDNSDIWIEDWIIMDGENNSAYPHELLGREWAIFKSRDLGVL